ncbi:MAG: NFACT family protein [Clostridia bacterium]|nr:NFACT family protein [Clostridia bacterium]
MALDGAFVHKVLGELKTAIDCHIDKIYQPSRDELVFLLRKKGFQKRLFISAKSGAQRVHFTENKYENPSKPPMFCMLMRKYLLSARLIDILQPELERVITFVFSATSEMGDITEIRLVCELIGGKANIVLVNCEGKIIDALRRSDVETANRLILPGATYTLPERQEKLNPLNSNADKILSQAQKTSFLQAIDGFSPLICREIENSQDTKSGLEKIINDLKNETKPILILDKNGEPFDFTFTEISQYGNSFQNRIFESFSQLLDAFYTAKENILRVNTNAKDILKLINNLKNRTQKKLALRLQELKKCENREHLRIYGELIKANIFAIEKGASFAEVPNYYSENLETVRIPLDTSLSPQNNANKYFKEYKKTYTAEQTLKELTEKDRQELIYFDSVLDSIERASSLSDIAQIREELADGGYIKQHTHSKKQKEIQNEFKEYTSIEGYKILVGKNNKQNDSLTTVIASKQDLWFHVKNQPGSHVVVFCGTNEVSQETILKAALLAAQNSKAQNSSNVAVDYTPIKYVKKPKGAKAGMVIYTTNKTVYVTPKGEN